MVSEQLRSMTLKDDAKFKGKLICRLKKHWLIFMRAGACLKNLHFDQMFYSKAYKDLNEKVQKSWSRDTEE